MNTNKKYNINIRKVIVVILLFFISGCTGKECDPETRFKYKCVDPKQSVSETATQDGCKQFVIKDDFWKFKVTTGGGGSSTCNVADPNTSYGLVSYIVVLFKTTLCDAVGEIFQRFRSDQNILGLYLAVVSISIASFGIFTLLRIREMNPGNLLVLAGKLGFVTVLVTNYDVFFRTILSFLFGLQATLIEAFGSAIVSGMPNGIANLKQGTEAEMLNAIDDLFIKILINEAFWRVFASLFYPLTNAILALVLLLIFWGITARVVSFVKQLLTATFGMFLLAAVAPIYFTFLLLESTKSTTDAWLDAMLSYVFKVPVLFLLIIITLEICMSILNGCVFTNPDQYLCYKTVKKFLFISIMWWVPENLNPGPLDIFHWNNNVNSFCAIVLIIVLFLMKFIEDTMSFYVDRITGAITSLGGSVNVGLGTALNFIGNRLKDGGAQAGTSFSTAMANRSGIFRIPLALIAGARGAINGAVVRPVWNNGGRGAWNATGKRAVNAANNVARAMYKRVTGRDAPW
jgi:type IV secretory pathway VirB6-like protein